MHGMPAGILEEIETGKRYRFIYFESYNGPSISLTMPLDGKEFLFDRFPPSSW
jgi:HipA-like protein